MSLEPTSAMSVEEGRWVRCPAVVAAISALLLMLVVSMVPQGLHYYDPVLQTIALRQYQEGISPNPNTLMRVDPADLTAVIPEWIAWWPPSTQLLAGSLLPLGGNFAQGLRLGWCLALLVGAVGWTLWFQRFLSRGWLLYILAAAVPWIRYAAYPAFRYTAEILAYAFLPWVLLGAVLIAQAWMASPRRAFLLAPGLGLLVGLSYLAKYSVGIPSGIAMVAVAAYLFLRHRDIRALGLLALILGSCLIIPVGWKILGQVQGGMDPASSFQFRLQAMDFLAVFANPGLAVFDLFGPLSAVTRNKLFYMAIIALPGGLFIVALAVRRWLNGLRSLMAQRDFPIDEMIGLTVFLGNLTMLFLLWKVTLVDHFPRHIQPASMALLPVVLKLSIDLYTRVSKGFWRIVLLGLLGLHVLVPTLYGPVYVTLRIKNTVAQKAPFGPSGAWQAELAPAGFGTMAAILDSARKENPDAIWVVDNPELALDLPGRFMLPFQGRTIEEDLLFRAQSVPPTPFATSKPVVLLMVLPPWLSPESEAAHSREFFAAFPGVTLLTKHALPGSRYHLWTMDFPAK